MVPSDFPTGTARRVTLTAHPSMSVIALTGDVDDDAVDELRVAVRWAADRGLPVRVHVQTRNALGAGAADLLAQLSDSEQRQGRSLVVVGATAEQRQAMTESGLHRLVIFEDGTTSDL